MLLLFSSAAPARPRADKSPSSEAAAVIGSGACATLREQIPGQYRERYDRWKAVLLSADAGRRLWLRYACSPSFHLTIIVSDGQGQGGEIKLDDYRWDEGGLTAATIVLGHRLDRGYPGLPYYPVLNSLYDIRTQRAPWAPDDILAAAKIAHELGHVDQAAKADPAGFRLQNELGKVYASHFRANGYDTHDPALGEIAARMGGAPEVVSAQREYWAETYALRYLLDKLRPDKRRTLLKSVRKSLTSEPSIYYLPSRTEWQTLATFD
ncbi:MAG TPA: hypothetical protein VNZ44_05040 [Pyrinomonadaceae bacterium]|nr:hypothetical protein [Pyrinomonadaceae bacterium]